MRVLFFILIFTGFIFAQTDLNDISDKSAGDLYTATEFNLVKNDINAWKYISVISSSVTERTITMDEILAGYVFVCNTATDTIILTLPAQSTIPNDGYVHQFSIAHRNGDYPVFVYCAASDSFVYNNTWFNLRSKPFFFNFGAINTGTVQDYGLQRTLTIAGSFHREATWSSSNFSSLAIIPLDNESYNDQDEILQYTGGANSRVTVAVAGKYNVSYVIDINSTGGSTWNATAVCYKNGSVLGDTRSRTGNYGNEDQSLSIPPVQVNCDTGDYLDLRIDQNNLTGQIEHTIFMVEITL